ncbi:MAG: sialidase family protein [Gemmatimonadales bacterium]
MNARRLALLLLLAPPPHPGDAPTYTDVFTPAADGFVSIRIPSLVVTKHGTLLAFAEGRARDADQAANRIILKRSHDAGRRWSAVATIAADGDRSLNNPCAVVEQQSGRVLLMYQSYPAGVGERDSGLRTGYDGDRIVRTWLITSDDDGITWSAPRDLTRETKRKQGVTTVASGPGIGIQLRHGPHARRLVMPFNEGPWGLWHIYAVYSDDGGRTWRMGAVAPGGLIDQPGGGQVSTVNEVQLVELDDGSLRFNARRWAGRPLRKTAISTDGGESWSDIADVPELRDPSSMASVLRYSFGSRGHQSRILFSGPASDKRENGTVFLSRDNGATWPVSRVLWAQGFAYSVLAVLPDGSVGCLFEADGTRRIVFARFTLRWLTSR